MNKATLLAFCATVLVPATSRFMELGDIARALTFLHRHIIAVSTMGIALSASKLNVAVTHTLSLTAACAFVRKNLCAKNTLHQ
jgi:hypothetical protein